MADPVRETTEHCRDLFDRDPVAWTQITTVGGCSCGTHGEPVVGDLAAEPTEHAAGGP